MTGVHGTAEISAREAVGFEDWRVLAVAEGPCITVAVTSRRPIVGVSADRARWRGICCMDVAALTIALP